MLVLGLMGLNAVGAYGVPAKAHIGRQVDGDVAVAGRRAHVEARLTPAAFALAIPSSCYSRAGVELPGDAIRGLCEPHHTLCVEKLW